MENAGSLNSKWIIPDNHHATPIGGWHKVDGSVRATDILQYWTDAVNCTERLYHRPHGLHFRHAVWNCGDRFFV